MAKKEFIFKSRNSGEESKLEAPIDGCKASKVLLDILNMGDLPEGLELRYAKSYGAHFIAKKGRNALGFFDTKDQLVINGIAPELEAANVEGITKPTKSKNYKAIKLSSLKDKDIAVLTRTIARVLGFNTKATKTAKKTTAKAKKKAEKKVLAQEPVVETITEPVVS